MVAVFKVREWCIQEKFHQYFVFLPLLTKMALARPILELDLLILFANENWTQVLIFCFSIWDIVSLAHKIRILAPETYPFCQFLAPEILLTHFNLFWGQKLKYNVSFWAQKLKPFVRFWLQKISWHIFTVSGTRNWNFTSVSGARNWIIMSVSAQ